MFLLIDSSGNFYFVESHSHKDCGALIASAPPGYGEKSLGASKKSNDSVITF